METTHILKSDWIAKCHKCKTVKRLSRGTAAEMWNRKPLFVCQCGGRTAAKLISGVTTDAPCNSKCEGSKGHVCECACGGKNHGKAWA